MEPGILCLFVQRFSIFISLAYYRPLLDSVEVLQLRQRVLTYFVYHIQKASKKIVSIFLCALRELLLSHIVRSAYLWSKVTKSLVKLAG
jgi:hypothetical protein